MSIIIKIILTAHTGRVLRMHVENPVVRTQVLMPYLWLWGWDREGHGPKVGLPGPLDIRPVPCCVMSESLKTKGAAL